MGNYVRAVWRCRFFWLSLVMMDLRTRYRRSVLGLGWSLLHPIAMTATICIVFHHIMKMNIWHYGPYLLAGLACWNYILASTTTGCQSLLQGESYIRQYPAPIAIYPLRATLGATIHFLIALVVVLALMGYIKATGHQTATEHSAAALPRPGLASLVQGVKKESSAAPGTPPAPDRTTEGRNLVPLPLLSLFPTLVLLFVFCWSLAILAGFANVYFQDTQHLCEVGFQIFFYLTPIMYEPKQLGAGLARLLQWNPLVPMLNLIREPIVEGQFPTPGMYGLATVTVSLAAAAAILALVQLQKRVIFYM